MGGVVGAIILEFLLVNKTADISLFAFVHRPSE